MEVFLLLVVWVRRPMPISRIESLIRPLRAQVNVFWRVEVQRMNEASKVLAIAGTIVGWKGQLGLPGCASQNGLIGGSDPKIAR